MDSKPAMKASTAIAPAGVVAGPAPLSGWYKIYALAVLMGVNLFNYMDRSILSVLIEPIKAEFQATDTQMGILTGLAFALFYAICGFPIARLADRGFRVRVISWALAIWSAMTVLSGMTGAYWQMLLARMGVGVGEAGGNPPSQALLAEYFPLEQRARAIAFFIAGASIGTFLGTFLAGYIGQEYGWRWAFIILGAPGLAFALLVRFTLKEPPLRPKVGAEDSALHSGSMWEATRHLFKGRAFTHIMIAIGLLWFGNVGAGQWHAPFLQRSHDLSLKEVGVLLSLLAIPGLLSVIWGGFLADHMSKRNPIWLIYVPLISQIISLPFLLGFYFAPTWQLAITSIAIAAFFSGAFGGVLLAGIQGIVGPHARALAAAIMMFVSNLIGLGLGPFVTGIISDLLYPMLGQESLRWALIIMKIMPLLALLHLWLASKTFVQELRDGHKLQTEPLPAVAVAKAPDPNKPPE